MQSNLALNDFSSETLYSICQTASANKNWKDLLDDVLTLSRQYFIVDNLAIFLTDPESGRIDVIYAKSFGRGKSAEADVSWGETVANQVVQSQQLHLERPASSNSSDRFAQRYILAVPLLPTDSLPGAVTFIRWRPGLHLRIHSICRFSHQSPECHLAKKAIARDHPKVDG